jgi:hypothetical protein
MGWTAEVTKDGRKVAKNWDVKDGACIIIDPVLCVAFEQANIKMRQITGYNNYLLDGMLHGSSCAEILQLATGEPTFRNYIVDGQLEWSEELVQRLNLIVNWDIPKHSGHSEEYSWLPEAYEESDYWWVKVFWNVCIEHHLGLFLSF